MTENQRGLLISFDGVDSSGKETQTRLLVERLRRLGQVVQEFETPDYTTPSGQDLQRRLENKDGSWETTSWEDKMRFFATNRLEHREEVMAALAQGEMVVYDRYVPSSLAFMAVEALSTQPTDLVRQQVVAIVEETEYEHNLMPHEDISIFLDVPPLVSHDLLTKRKQQHHEADEYTDQLDIQNRLYNEYDVLCKNDSQRFARIPCVVEGRLLGIDEVAELIWSQLIKKFPQLESHA